MKNIIKLILIFQIGLQISHAQFPSICMNAGSLMEKECCPDFNGRGKCGEQDGRGKCGEIGSVDDTASVRDGWPYYYQRICMCTGNYAGYDCGRCKYGHYGEDCNNFTIIERRPISEFSPEDWKNYIDILNKSRMHNSDYMVFLREPEDESYKYDITLLQPTPIKLYELFVWQHHYSAKDNENEELDNMDYAHESTGFPTWHRQFLLWFEWEIQYMLKSMEQDDYYTFRIPYWDWRKEMQTDNNSPFHFDRLGKTTNINGLPVVQGGEVFPSSWNTICWEKTMDKSHAVCNPEIKTGQLQRCPFTDEPCSIHNPIWTSDKEVQAVLSSKSYDASPFSEKSLDSFRNQLEGFKPLSNNSIQTCRNDRLCLCSIGDIMCAESKNDTVTSIQPGDPIQRLLHNSIHIILGLGYFGSDAFNNPEISGVMADVAASANDPIFLNHHAMVDCIFETWLQRNPSAQYPQNDKIPQGHRQQDYIVPFFPLYKHQEMFSTADKFGYRCTVKSINHRLSPRVIAAITIAIVVGLCIAGYIAIIYLGSPISYFYICYYYCHDKKKETKRYHHLKSRN